MDAVWLILDSLSFEATPFAPDGPGTMPAFENLVADHGVNFTEAYAPGPFSPSSHASFITGALPSKTGMYEASPRYEGDRPTVGQVLSETHETHLVSTNMFLFQGLDRGFDQTHDFSRRYMLFRDASDPKNYAAMYNDDPWWKRVADLVFDDGKPLRSIANGVSYTIGSDLIHPKQWGDEENFQYVERLNQEISRRRQASDGDVLVVANYMDLHSPFDLSDEAMERFFPDTPRAELPLGVAAERANTEAEKSYDPDDLRALYEAAIWDFDRKFTPLVADLIDDGAFVAVFADHGPYDTNTAYADDRHHVPLVLFAPEEPARTVEYTVSLRSLPRTTKAVVQGSDGDFTGPSLLAVDEDQTAITEIIHVPNDVYERTGRVFVNRPTDVADPAEIQHDVVLYRGDAKVTFIGGECSIVRGQPAVTDDLEATGRALLAEGPTFDDEGPADVDDVTEERLKRLGYIDD